MLAVHLECGKYAGILSQLEQEVDIGAIVVDLPVPLFDGQVKGIPCCLKEVGFNIGYNVNLTVVDVAQGLFDNAIVPGLE
ncbi:MAG: hypothetical protein ACP5PZ_11610 [Bacteroidales bacterium]